MARDTHMWHAHFYDGQTAQPHTVQVEVLSNGLEIVFSDRPSEIWTYGNFRQTEGFHSGELVRFEKSDTFGQALVTDDVEILEVIRERDPDSGFHNPRLRRYRVPLIGFSLVSIVLIIWMLYGYILPVFVDGIARIAPVAWEESLGRSVVAYIAPEDNRCTDEIYTEVFDEVIARLTAPTDLPYTFRVYVVKNAYVNAFALPGGYMAITTGFLKRVKSAEQIAGIIAHEMQHVVQRHGTRAVLREISTRTLIAAISGGGEGLDYVLDKAAMVGALRFSRDHESSADIEGMKMIIDAKIDPKGMVEVFEILLETTGDIPDGMVYVSTHPLTKNRIRSLSPYLDSLKVDPISLDSLKVAPIPIVSDSTWARFAQAIRAGQCKRVDAQAQPTTERSE